MKLNKTITVRHQETVQIDVSVAHLFVGFDENGIEIAVKLEDVEDDDEYEEFRFSWEWLCEKIRYSIQEDEHENRITNGVKQFICGLQKLLDDYSKTSPR